MKSIEEQIGGRCIHFNGLMEPACRCGINYKETFGKTPASKMPCIKERMTHFKDEVIKCDKLIFPSPEEVRRQIDEQNKGIALTLSALSGVKKHIKETGKKQGKIKCPNGDHELAYTQSDYNGHIWMACKTCNISMMQ